MTETVCAFFGIGIVVAVILLGVGFVFAYAMDAALWIAARFRRPQ